MSDYDDSGLIARLRLYRRLTLLGISHGTEESVFFCGVGGLNNCSIWNDKVDPYLGLEAHLKLDDRALIVTALCHDDRTVTASIPMGRFETLWRDRMGDRSIPTMTGQGLGPAAIQVFWETLLLFLRG